MNYNLSETITDNNCSLVKIYIVSGLVYIARQSILHETHGCLIHPLTLGHLNKLGCFYTIFDMLCCYIFSHDFSDKYAEITGKITQPTRFNAPCYTGKTGLIFKELNDSLRSSLHWRWCISASGSLLFCSTVVLFRCRDHHSPLVFNFSGHPLGYCNGIDLICNGFIYVGLHFVI